MKNKIIPKFEYPHYLYLKLSGYDITELDCTNIIFALCIGEMKIGIMMLNYPHVIFKREFKGGLVRDLYYNRKSIVKRLYKIDKYQPLAVKRVFRAISNSLLRSPELSYVHSSRDVYIPFQYKPVDYDINDNRDIGYYRYGNSIYGCLGSSPSKIRSITIDGDLTEWGTRNSQKL